MSINNTILELSSTQTYYKGKVRDVYVVEDSFIVVVSDRISAFDHILPRSIPFKGQVLNQLAKHFLDATTDIVPNWSIHSPHPNVMIGLSCIPIKIEMVVRGYLVGHALREYKLGKRSICGVPLKEGLLENQQFDQPIITPATKADEGHDLDISREEIIDQEIVDASLYTQMESISLALFERGQEMALERGLILVDTKYEFGLYDGKLYLIDEIHTPDSSRYFYKQEYEERFEQGLPQNQLSKEFVREWLIENNFMGKEGQSMPVMPDSFVNQVSERYIELYEILTGKSFDRASQQDINNDIFKSIKHYLEN